MKKELYTLANELDFWDKCEYGYEDSIRLDEISKQKYQSNILNSIHKEQKEKKSRCQKRFAATAACLVLITAFAFNSSVQAAVTKSFNNIGVFLGIKNDLSKYTEVIGTSVNHNGYLATLREVIVAQDKVAVYYTLQRENGEAFPCFRTLSCALYVDGKEIYSGMGQSDFADKAHKIQSEEMTYFVEGMDLTEEKVYELKISDYGSGKWNFKFKASGAELAADTKRMELGHKFNLPNGGIFELSNLTVNNFEQRFHYYYEGTPNDYQFRLDTTDDQGREVRFYQELYTSKRKNYLLNDNSYIAADAKTLTVEIKCVKCGETDTWSSDWEKLGEITLDLSALR